MGLHPALAATRAAVRRTLRPLTEASAVLVACSGGADSIALVAAASREGERLGLRVVGVSVDHQLQEGSDQHAQRVAGQMRGLGVAESVIATVTVDAEGMGPEAAARVARYDVLTELATRYGAARVLLGHTLDDQAETVLMGLTRGSGSRSLAGMRRSFDGFERPFLDLRREDTVTACVTEGLAFWTDPHNSDERFTRVRVRSRVLPMLEAELGPGVAQALARTADQLRTDNACLDAVAEASLAQVHTAAGDLDVDQLLELPEAISTRVLRVAALAAGAIPAELFRVHVLALLDLASNDAGGRQVQLPGHVTALREGRTIRFRRTS